MISARVWVPGWSANDYIWVNRAEALAFHRACRENGIRHRALGYTGDRRCVGIYKHSPIALVAFDTWGPAIALKMTLEPLLEVQLVEVADADA